MPTNKRRLTSGAAVNVHIYKADGTLYRQWNKTRVIEDNERQLVLLLYRTKVVESNGKRWMFDNPTIVFFPHKRLFNALIRFENNHPQALYCNIASPCKVEGNIVSFIDYDLDIKWNYDRRFQVVDWNEFAISIKDNLYSNELIEAIYQELEHIDLLYRSHEYVFNTEEMEAYYNRLRKSRMIRK